MLTFDHLVVAAETLEAGVAHIRETLGVDIPFGGKHPLMATHNHLMQLGDAAFLEVIAVDPEATTENTRWYELDTFEGPPRLIHWVVRVEDVADAAQLAVDVGPPLDVTRGDLYWQLTVRPDGSLPYDGAYPSVIDWPDEVFPVPKMANLGCSLERFTVVHPEGAAVQAALEPFLEDRRVEVFVGDQLALKAEIMTPSGLRVL